MNRLYLSRLEHIDQFLFPLRVVCLGTILLKSKMYSTVVVTGSVQLLLSKVGFLFLLAKKM